MTQNAKTQKTQMSLFLQNHKETEIEIFAFCTITFEPIESFFLHQANVLHRLCTIMICF